MSNPYMLKCGHSFEKLNIIRCLEQSETCPVCRAPATEEDLFPNYSLKGVIKSKFNKIQKQNCK